jgi:DnaJ family protein A protein 2
LAGDLYVRIKVHKHKTFERKGADLFFTKKITLLEALTGVQFQLKFLDDSTLTITTLPGEIISPCNPSFLSTTYQSRR